MDSPHVALDSLAASVSTLSSQLSELQASLKTKLDDLEARVVCVEQSFSSAGRFRVRDLVRIIGLDNAAHQHLNSKKAQLRSWEGPGGRWVVQVLQTGEMKSLKVDNLFPEAEGGNHDHGWGGHLGIGDAVEIKGLRRQGRLNGTRGEVTGWDDAAGRWIVKLVGSTQRKRLRVGNLKRVGEAINVSGLRPSPRATSASASSLEPGVTVQLNGLRKGGLNGKLARVQRWDSQADRFVVQMLETREEKSLRAENLSELEASLRAGQLAVVRGLEQAAHLNGSHVELMQWDLERSRWNVRLTAADETKSLRPESVFTLPEYSFKAGQLVLIASEGGGPEALHHKKCELKRWDSDAGQWFVHLKDDANIDVSEYWLRPRYLRRLPASDDLPENSEGSDVAELLGESSDASDEDRDCSPGMSCDILREGSLIRIDGVDGALNGQRGRLICWEDVGGPFGQWRLKLIESTEIISLAPVHLEHLSQ